MEHTSIKVIHTVSSISEETGGPAYSVMRLCDSLVSQGNDVCLATLEDGVQRSSPLFLKTFRFGLGPKRLGTSPDMKHWLLEVAQAGEVDLIHNHGLWMMPNVYPGQAARRYDVPLMVAPRGMLSEWAMQNGSYVKKIFYPFLQRPVLKKALCFHATAEAEYADIRRLGFTQPVCILPNGVDVPPLVGSSEGKSRRILLFLGRIHQKKGVDMLLYAWKAVYQRFPEWELHIVGSGKEQYVTMMKNLTKRLCLDRVSFFGPLYNAQKWEAYRNADIFVLPTHSENFGMTVAEALATGTPAIVTKGAPWEKLEIEGAGWWIDIGVEPLTACLEKAMDESEGRLIQMGKAGRDWMNRDFSWEKIGIRMTMVYRWLLDGGKAPEWVLSD